MLPQYFSNDFVFKDPDVSLTGIQEYCEGVRKIFDQATARSLGALECACYNLCSCIVVALAYGIACAFVLWFWAPRWTRALDFRLSSPPPFVFWIYAEPEPRWPAAQ